LELCRRRHNSKERRLEPQITVGLLTDAAGFPLMVNAFEGNKAETATIVPVLQAFQTLHGLADVTVVADAGMISDANMKAIEAAGLSFILGARIPKLPYVIDAWRKAHPDTEFTDGQIWTQPWPAGPKDKRRDQVHYYQWKADRARRTSKGSTSRSPRPSTPSPARPRSSGTGSSTSTAARER
jgi:hypothetical protein